ncbi:hypothetical protein V6Z12_A08G017200 [Gossypium hirsutum]
MVHMLVLPALAVILSSAMDSHQCDQPYTMALLPPNRPEKPIDRDQSLETR